MCYNTKNTKQEDIIMKKVLAFILCFVLIFALGVSASAAGTYGVYEQKVVEFLSKEYKFTSGSTTATFVIPANYANQAKAYLLKTEGDITEAQYNEIIKFVDEGRLLVENAVKADASVIKDGKVNIASLPNSVKANVLKKGQSAVAVVGLSMVVDKEQKVVITDAADNVVFKDAAIIKTTGANVDTVSIVLCVTSILALAGAAVVVSKKAKLF